MQRIVAVLGVVLLWSLPVMAETYTWTDKSGTVNFSDDYSSVPKQYRKKVRRLGDMGAAPAAADTGGKDGVQQPAQPPAPETAPAPPVAATGNGLYGGKKAAAWQQEFRERAAGLKQLEGQLAQFVEAAKKPLGAETRERLQMDYNETQRQYNEAVKAYNELNAAANKAGLPAEFRK